MPFERNKTRCALSRDLTDSNAPMQLVVLFVLSTMSLDKQSTAVYWRALTGMLCSSPADCFPQRSDSTSKVHVRLSSRAAVRLDCCYPGVQKRLVAQLSPKLTALGGSGLR